VREERGLDQTGCTVCSRLDFPVPGLKPDIAAGKLPTHGSLHESRQHIVEGNWYN
jgi:hypothetical protein